MKPIIILVLAVVVVLLLVCAAGLLGRSIAERDQQKLEQEIQREAEENLRKAKEAREKR